LTAFDESVLWAVLENPFLDHVNVDAFLRSSADRRNVDGGDDAGAYVPIDLDERESAADAGINTQDGFS
jgi:hypothetical protein